MAAHKGTMPPNAGKGRLKGVPNKITATLKEQVLGGLEDVGGRKYFAEMARKQPAAFMGLLGRILPMQVTGEGDGPLTLIIETGVSRAGRIE